MRAGCSRGGPRAVKNPHLAGRVSRAERILDMEGCCFALRTRACEQGPPLAPHGFRYRGRRQAGAVADARHDTAGAIGVLRWFYKASRPLPAGARRCGGARRVRTGALGAGSWDARACTLSGALLLHVRSKLGARAVAALRLD
jgi:hypothetical protein